MVAVARLRSHAVARPIRFFLLRNRVTAQLRNRRHVSSQLYESAILRTDSADVAPPRSLHRSLRRFPLVYPRNDLAVVVEGHAGGAGRKPFLYLHFFALVPPRARAPRRNHQADRSRDERRSRSEERR